MKDSGVEWIGEIPEDWVINPLSNKFKEHKVKNIGNTEKNVLSLSYGHIVKRNVDNNKGLLPESFETYNIVFPGNIVLRLTDLQNDQKSWRVGLVKEKGIITSAYLTLEAECNDISNTFYYYLFHIYDRTKIIYNMGNGVRQNLKYSELSKMPIVVPPIKQQTRLASFLDTKCSVIDSTIEKEREVIDKLKEYRQAVITEAVTTGIRAGVPMKDSGVEWIGEIPVGWTTYRIKYNTYLKGRIGWQGLKSSEFIDEGPYLVTGTDFKNGRVNWNTAYHISLDRYNEAPEIQLKVGDLLITKDGTVGKLAFIDCLPDKASLNSHLVVLRSTTKKYTNKYLYWVLSSDVFTIYTELKQDGSIMASLSQEKLNNFTFSLPPLSEQQDIVDYLDAKCSAIDATIQKRELAIEKLTQYKQSLIYECVTGKREVQG